MSRGIVVALLITLSLGCSSTANHGLLTGPLANPVDLVQEAHEIEEIGPVEGRRCRFFFVNVFPWGDSTTGAALEKALQGTGGDAIVNSTVITSLYGFVPIYNVLSFTCTTVKGVAVRFD